MSYSSKSSLSPRRRALIERMQSLNFGRIEQLVVEQGEPVFGPNTRVVREHKFGGENGPRPEAALSDFPLKGQVIELFGLLDQIRDGTVDLLEIKHGVPFRTFVADSGD
jgi:hypothetical protein